MTAMPLGARSGGIFFPEPRRRSADRSRTTAANYGEPTKLSGLLPELTRNEVRRVAAKAVNCRHLRATTAAAPLYFNSTITDPTVSIGRPDR